MSRSWASSAAGDQPEQPVEVIHGGRWVRQRARRPQHRFHVGEDYPRFGVPVVVVADEVAGQVRVGGEGVDPGEQHPQPPPQQPPVPAGHVHPVVVHRGRVQTSAPQLRDRRGPEHEPTSPCCALLR